MWLKYASRVVAVAHLLDGQVEDRRVEAPLPLPRRGDGHAAARSAARTACSAASATSSWAALGSLVERCRWSSVPGRASARESRLSGFRLIQPKTSTAAPTAPTAPTTRAAVRWRAGASSAAAPASAVARRQRPDQVRAAALVLLRGALSGLVGPDRDVLGAVVRGQLLAAQRDQRRHERGDHAPRPRAGRSAATSGGRARRPSTPRRARPRPRGARTAAVPREGPASSRGAPRTPRPAAAGRARTAPTPRRRSSAWGRTRP